MRLDPLRFANGSYCLDVLNAIDWLRWLGRMNLLEGHEGLSLELLALFLDFDGPARCE